MPTPKGYKHRKLGKAASCAVGSFRRVKSGRGLVTVCCPRGKWKRGRCLVGMKAIGVDFRGLSKLSKGARAEAREHPWASKAEAKRIARDHLREDPKAYGWR